MLVFKSKKELNGYLSGIKQKKGTLGLVPTMGALHDGHLSLVKKAILENNYVVVTIFVNPTQFNNPEDLEKYPKTFENDVALLKKVSDELIIFAPPIEDIYEGDLKTESFAFDGLDLVMEGEFRDNHFNGVATIVKKLFKIVGPDKAYFGEKDYQQLQIIKKLVDLEKVTVDIIPCSIEREPNGLARSSRNERLSKKVRESAGFIYQTLTTAKSKFGMENVNTIEEWVEQQFKENGVFKLEYFKIADSETLLPISKKKERRKYRAFIAVYAEEVRLIDNIKLN